MTGTEKYLQQAAALLLLALTAACAFLLLSSGSDVYSGITDRDDGILDRRTADAYLTARLRAYDAAGSIGVLDADLEPSDTGPVLALYETLDGREYRTLMFVRDGTLQELFSPVDAMMGLEGGDPVLDMDGASFAIDGDTLEINIGPNGGPYRTVSFQPRSTDAFKTERRTSP